jgi:argininosuccinate lyase
MPSMKNKGGGKRLWDKGGDVDALVHRFTVGDDPQTDLHLVHFDVLGSAAHARTLHNAGLLTDSDLTSLLRGLREIDELARRGEFTISDELEDGHTAIEAYLTVHAGDAGARIHAGRSRNDQVATAMRLYLRQRALDWFSLLHRFAETCLERIDADGELPLPGYTHMQPAMPSSVGQWLHAWVEAALDQMRAALHLLERLNACPLGTGAGFGVPLPLDREYTASVLGFSHAERSAIHVQNSRGRVEQLFVRVGVDIAASLEKMASDLILYSSGQFGFLALPASMTTGSSLMPQKRNPDVLELMRGRAGVLRGRLHTLESVCAKLPSSYHRDLQLTKAPAIAAALDIAELLPVATHVLAGLQWNAQKLEAAMGPELYATAAALDLVRSGTPFREAYRQIAGRIAVGEVFGPGADHAARPEIVTGAILDAVREDLAGCAVEAQNWQRRLERAEAAALRD